MKTRLLVASTYAIALVWLINGLYCKVLGMVPRHREIVARILGEANSGWVTKGIGVLEILMAVWVVSGMYRKVNAWTQVIVVMTMNTMEFMLAPDLLLFGRMNIVVASLFSIIVVLWGRATQDTPSTKT